MIGIAVCKFCGQEVEAEIYVDVVCPHCGALGEWDDQGEDDRPDIYWSKPKEEINEES
jgi:hypothetical protein